MVGGITTKPSPKTTSKYQKWEKNVGNLYSDLHFTKNNINNQETSRIQKQHFEVNEPLKSISYGPL